MIVDKIFVEVALWLALIFSAPAIYAFTRVLIRYFVNRFIPINTVVITHIHNGVVVKRREIKATGYVVDQLESLKVGASHE